MKEVQDETRRTRTGNGRNAPWPLTVNGAVNPCPAGRKTGVLFPEVRTVRQYKAKGAAVGAIWTGRKSAETIVAVLGDEGRNQS